MIIIVIIETNTLMFISAGNELQINKMGLYTKWCRHNGINEYFPK